MGLGENQEPLCSIYVVIERQSFRKYIGITKRGVNKRWKEHMNYAITGQYGLLDKAIWREGPEAFRVKTLLSGIEHGMACAVEAYLIDRWSSRERGGFNVSYTYGSARKLLPIVMSTGCRRKGRKRVDPWLLRPIAEKKEVQA